VTGTLFRTGGRVFEVEVESKGSAFVVRCGDRRAEISLADLGDGVYTLALPDRTVTLHAVADGETRWIAFNGRTYELRRELPARSFRPGTTATGEGILRAPMPGQVRSVEVAVGDLVRKGQTLLLLEAMKMEIRIQSPVDGAVAALPIAAGQQVEREQVLIEIE
jgi:biotin carboxyl carrier protein